MHVRLGRPTAALAALALAATGAATPAHWSYEGKDGPAHWAQLDPAYAACGEGYEQSPIDLPAIAPAGRTRVTLTGRTAHGRTAGNGHTVQLTVDGDRPRADFQGHAYRLRQLHDHTPAEHTVAGRTAAAEFHLVYADDAGQLLVVGVRAVKGAASPGWQPFVRAAAHPGKSTATTLHVSALLPSALAFDTYSGSLTTPPCTEGVRWVMFAAPIQLSARQLDVLRRAYGRTARPVQLPGARTVTGGRAVVNAG